MNGSTRIMDKFVSILPVFGWALLSFGLAGCLSDSNGRSFPKNNPHKKNQFQLQMGMTPAKIIQIWPDTPCKVDSLFHGNPAQTWGYRAKGIPPSLPPKPSSCDRANYWIYFEKDRLVGWTPPR